MSSTLVNRCAALALALTAAVPAGAQQKLTLQQAIDLAQRQGLHARSASAARDAARANDAAFTARQRPQLSLFGTAPMYDKSIKAIPQPDGTTIFAPTVETQATMGAGVTQQLPFTGGTLTFGSSLDRVDATGAPRRWSSTPFFVALQQNLLRPNALRWDSRVQDIAIDVAERQYLEAREGIALQTSNAFFDLHVAEKALTNAIGNASINDTLYRLNTGRFEVGKIGENDLLQSELALLRSRTALENARLEHARALAAFRLAVNLAPGTAVEIVPPEGIPDLEPDTAVAVAQALRNRAQVSEQELQSVQSQRRVSEARLNNGIGAIVTARLGFNQSGTEREAVYQDLLESQRLQVNVSVPLIQWGARGKAIQSARADQERVSLNARVTSEQTAMDAHFAALMLSQARRNANVSAKADTVATKRFDVAYNRYVVGKIGIDNLYIAQNEKEQAAQQYLQSLRGYWAAYFRLRQLTLYDFERGAVIR